MKCEICHKANAETVLLRKKEDGPDEELYVCRECAAKADKKLEGRDPRTVMLNSGDGKPPPFVEDLLKATLGFVKGMAEEQSKAAGKLKDVCPTCGKKRESFHKDGILGCPDCWSAFAIDLRERFTNSQYGVRHIGSTPAAAPRMDICKQLERQLKLAVRRQDFEKAAAIRSKLEELGGRSPLGSSPEKKK